MPISVDRGFCLPLPADILAGAHMLRRRGQHTQGTQARQNATPATAIPDSAAAWAAVEAAKPEGGQPSRRHKRETSVGPPDDQAPADDGPRSVGMRELERLEQEWDRTGAHQKIRKAVRELGVPGNTLSDEAIAARQAAYADIVVDAWKANGGMDRVVRALVATMKEERLFDGFVHHFRTGYYPDLSPAQAEKKFVADLAAWDTLSRQDKILLFPFYLDPAHMLDARNFASEEQEADSDTAPVIAPDEQLAAAPLAGHGYA
jgi:hypothetical protein